MKAILQWLAGCSLIALIVAGAWFMGLGSLLFHKSEPVHVSVPAKEAKEVKGKPKITVAAPKGVRVYQPEAKLKLNLPPTVVANKDEQVISTARVDNTTRPHTVTTTINTETGEATSFVRADPYPWVALESRGELGVSGGYKYRYRQGVIASFGRPVVPIMRLDVRQDFLQLKALHVGVMGTVDTDGDAYVGVRVSYKW